MIALVHKPVLPLNRSLALSLVIGAHAAGVYLIAVHGLIRPIIADPEVPTLRAFFPVDEPRQPQPQLPQQSQALPLDVRFAQPADLPRIVFDAPPLEPADAPLIAGTAESFGTPAAVAEPVIVSTPLTWQARRAAREFYPAASIRLGEEGVTTLRVCVGPDGALLQPPRVTSGSGHARLDAAAIAWAGSALAFRPATQNGVATQACKPFRVNFTLSQ